MKSNKVCSCISRRNLPCCMEPETCHVDSLFQLPNTGSAGVILGNFIKGSSSGQGVPAATRAVPTIKHRPLFFSQPKIFLLCLLTSISLRSGFPDFQRLTPLLNTLMIHCIYVGMQLHNYLFNTLVHLNFSSQTVYPMKMCHIVGALYLSQNE